MDADREALDPEQLLAHAGWVQALARRLVLDQARVDDVVQETWLTALGRRPRSLRDTRAWLGGILRNVIRQDRRRERRLRRREQAAARPECEPGDGDLVLRAESLRAVVDAVLELREPYRSTVLAMDLEGARTADVARRAGVSAATLRSRRARALAMLRERLDERCGDRREWSLALLPLALPRLADTGAGAAALGPTLAEGLSATAPGVLIVSTPLKLTLAMLTLAALIGSVLLMPEPEGGSPRETRNGLLSVDRGPVHAGAPAAELPAPTPATGPRPLAGEPPPGAVATTPLAGTQVLRVVLEGVTEAEARLARVALSGVDPDGAWPTGIQASWTCRGVTSDLDLDPFLATVDRHQDLRIAELEITVDHPHRLRETVRLPFTRGAVRGGEGTLHEVRVELLRPEFWPEVRLAVRDAHTRAHLEDVELRIAPGAGSAAWGRNSPDALLGTGLDSPVALMGGRDATGSRVTVAGLALRPAAGEQPRLVELAYRLGPERGVIVSARAPGYAWGSTAIDVSEGERELLLGPASALGVRLSNVQLGRYAALETIPMLCVYWVRPDGGNQYVHFERLDETLAAEGLRLDNLTPGDYRVAVELGGGSWTQQPVLALEEVSLAAGGSRELLLTLSDPPAPPERATLGGLISLPSPAASWDEAAVSLQLYFQPTQRWREPDHEFALADLPRVGGTRPSWSFRVEDLPVGTYRVQLMPFLKVWMVDLPAGGAEDLELSLPELAEVLVETVDGLSGERVPRQELWYRRLEPAPGQQQNDLARAEVEEPGRFRFRAAPGPVIVWPQWPNGAEREFGGNGQVFELVPGFQSVRFDFAPVHALRLRFREDGTSLPTGPQGLHTTEDIRAVDHDGRVVDGGLQRDMVVEVSAPGLYEIRFERIDLERYHPVPPRLVDVLPGQTVEVIVDLRRR